MVLSLCIWPLELTYTAWYKSENYKSGFCSSNKANNKGRKNEVEVSLLKYSRTETHLSKRNILQDNLCEGDEVVDVRFRPDASNNSLVLLDSNRSSGTWDGRFAGRIIIIVHCATNTR